MRPPISLKRALASLLHPAYFDRVLEALRL